MGGGHCAALCNNAHCVILKQFDAFSKNLFDLIALLLCLRDSKTNTRCMLRTFYCLISVSRYISFRFVNYERAARLNLKRISTNWSTMVSVYDSGFNTGCIFHFWSLMHQNIPTIYPPNIHPLCRFKQQTRGLEGAGRSTCTCF